MLTIDFESDLWVVKRDGAALASFVHVADTEQFLDEMERMEDLEHKLKDKRPDRPRTRPGGIPGNRREEVLAVR